MADDGLACGEVRGGNQPVHAAIELPGLRGVLYSSTCDGAHGGDIHYLSVCGSGLLARLCLGDVAGHGQVVAKVGAEVYAQLRRSVDIVDERRVLHAIDRRIVRSGVQAMTTAVLATYYPPSRRLAVSYAGHPPAWIRPVSDGRWRPIDDEPASASTPTPVGLPLGTGLSPTYTRRRLTVSVGDQLLLLTDGVLEAATAMGAELGHAGLGRLLSAYEGEADGLIDHLVNGLRLHTGLDRCEHDDVTMFVGEIVEGPPGPALWHVFKNRLGRGNGRDAGRITPLGASS